jgi:glycosyltransferase involved in cell wall biosynthesis/2-polyprenyl-3-methyl-5-hydroxy-6-metoxy-1,4-benzoquinol methylase
MHARDQQPPRRIGYLVNAFPVISETFILNELRAMERASVPTAIIALARREDAVRHKGVEELTGPVCRPPEVGVRALLVFLRAHAALALRMPVAYLRWAGEDVRKLLRLSLRGGRAGRRTMLKRWRRFLLSGWVGERARRLGLAHLHAHYAKEPVAIAERVKRLTGLPYSFAAHAKDLYTGDPRVLSRRLSHAEFAVTCHEHGYRYLRAIAAKDDAEKVQLVHHGIDTRLFRSQREVTRDNPPLILAIGRLTPKKGFDDLVAACALLRRDGIRFHCVIVGEGRLEKELIGAIRAARLDDLATLSPFLSQEQLVDWCRRATVLAAPSRVTEDGNRDGIPNVVIEAMACGLPVVSTPVGGIPEMVRDGVDGLLVEPGDAGGLASALRRVLDDPDLAASISRSASRKVERLDFRRTVSPLVDRFRGVLTSPARQALERVNQDAWRTDGIAVRARKRLGVNPMRDPEVERRITKCVEPGLTANGWRKDLDRLAERRMWDEVYKSRRLLRARAVESWRGKRVVDVGCGRGGLTVSLAAFGADVVGVDLRRRNCEVTRLRARRYGLSPRMITTRAEALPLADRSFDHVFCLEVLEHVHDPVAVLREIRRVLVPGGTCTVTVINRWAHLDPHYHLWGVNLMPRSWARRYITLRGRAKRSWRDLQTLDEMHYFRYRHFVVIARSVGFEVADPERPHRRAVRTLVHDLSRRLSIGFNTATLTLVSRSA